MAEAALPARGFIRDYIDCFEPTTEAPAEYHQAVALVLVAVAIGREAWLQLAGRLYLNVYVLILGPSAAARKSTALRYGQTTIRRAAKFYPGRFREEWLLPSGTISAEALIERLTKIDRGLLVLDEFGRLLAGAKSKSYMADVKEAVTEVYGGWAPGRLTRDSAVDGGPCHLSIVGATTRSRFEDEITADDVASGFLGRFLLVYAEGTDKVLPFPPSVDEEAVTRVVNGLERIAKTVRGEITFSPEARALISDWYVAKREELPTGDDAELALPLFFRLDGTVRKLAALMEAAAAPRPRLVVSEQSAADAIAYAEFVLGQIRRRLLDGVLGDLARKLQRIRSEVERRPGVTKSVLMKVTNVADPEFTKLTEMLDAEGEIVLRRGQGRNKRGIAYFPAETGG